MLRPLRTSSTPGIENRSEQTKGNGERVIYIIHNTHKTKLSFRTNQYRIGHDERKPLISQPISINSIDLADGGVDTHNLSWLGCNPLLTWVRDKGIATSRRQEASISSIIPLHGKSWHAYSRWPIYASLTHIHEYCKRVRGVFSGCQNRPQTQIFPRSYRQQEMRESQVRTLSERMSHTSIFNESLTELSQSELRKSWPIMRVDI